MLTHSGTNSQWFVNKNGISETARKRQIIYPIALSELKILSNQSTDHSHFRRANRYSGI